MSASRDEQPQLTRETLVQRGRQLVKRATEESVAKTLSIVEQQNQTRKQAEDVRANKRNFNRMLMLIGALLIGIVVSFTLTHPAVLASVGVSPATSSTLQPYTFSITIMLDAALAIYAYVKKY